MSGGKDRHFPVGDGVGLTFTRQRSMVPAELREIGVPRKLYTRGRSRTDIEIEELKQ